MTLVNSINYENNTTYFWVARIVAIIQTIFIFGVTLLHSYRYICVRHAMKVVLRNKQKNTIKNNWIWFADVLTFAALSMYCANDIYGGLQIWSMFDDKQFSCKYIELFMNISYQFCKLCIYAILIARIQLAFVGTEYSYNKLIIIFLYLFIVSYYVLSVYLQSKLLTAEWMYSPDSWCQTYFPTWLVAMILGCDVFISLLTLFMFIRPLKILLAKIDGVIKDNAFHILISKYVILSSIAIFSTLIAFAGTALFGYTVLLAIDDMINVACIVLITTIHDRDYHWLCKCWYQPHCCLGVCPCVQGFASTNTIETNDSKEAGYKPRNTKTIIYTSTTSTTSSNDGTSLKEQQTNLLTQSPVNDIKIDENTERFIDAKYQPPPRLIKSSQDST